MISKKLLLLLASVGLLAGCGEQPAPTPEPDPDPVTPDPDLPDDEDDGMYDIKIVCTPVYNDFELLDTNAVWLGTAYGGENGEWATYKLEKQEDGTWTIEFKDVELGSYGYSFYLAEVDSTNIWNEKYMNAETVDNKPRSFIVDSDKTFRVPATFNAQPVPTADSLVVNLSITNYTWTVWPQFVYAEEGSSTYIYSKDCTQDSEDSSKFVFTIKNLEKKTYVFHISLWYDAGNNTWPEVSMYSEDGADFSVSVDGETVINLTGTLAANKEGRGTIVTE